MRRAKNPPLKRVRVLGPNMTEVEHGDITILYSYETPVAVFLPGAGYLRTEQHFSVTTSKHIGKWAGQGVVKKVPQAVIAHLAEFADPEDAQVATSIAGWRAHRNPRPAFTHKDVGGWIDGAFGEDHARAKLVGILEEYFGSSPGVADIIRGLEGEPSDDLSEMDDATAYLQEHTAQGLVWMWDAGDLILTTEEEAGG